MPYAWMMPGFEQQRWSRGFFWFFALALQLATHGSRDAALAEIPVSARSAAEIPIDWFSGTSYDVAAAGQVLVAVSVCEFNQPDVCVTRSLDGGRTWLAPIAMADLSGRLRIGVAASGTLLISGGCGPAEPDVAVPCVYRSVDEGETWLRIELPFFPGSQELVRLTRPVASGTTWHVAGGLTQLDLWRSEDDGLTWQVSMLNERPWGVDSNLATDGGGNWVLVFEGGSMIRSADDGLTWSAPASIDSHGLTGAIGPNDIAGVPGGPFLLMFNATTSGALAAGSDCDLVAARSFDGGASWQDFRLVDPEAGRSRDYQNQSCQRPRLIREPAGGRLWTIWSDLGVPYSRSDNDLLYSLSDDDGATWARPAAFNIWAGGDRGGESDPSIAVTASGEVSVLFRGGRFPSSSNRFYRIASYSDCPVMPSATCHDSGNATLEVRNSPGADDSLQWAWIGSDAAGSAGFGDPLASTSYLFCVYEETTSGPQLIVEREIEAGGSCGSKPCWKKTRGGYRYADSRKAVSPVKSLSMSSSSHGVSRFQLALAGPALSPPTLPISADALTVQLNRIGTDDCWTSLHTRLSVNTTNLVVALP
ncbi:MAG TPA: sialidase family protein [Candidatus Binatia bacterium]|nr:sialidase family protein [Candidatus Binatia bacterium]